MRDSFRQAFFTVGCRDCNHSLQLKDQTPDVAGVALVIDERNSGRSRMWKYLCRPIGSCRLEERIRS
jgi:hypothetical protein